MKKLQFLLIAILALNCEAIINASTEDTNTDHNCQELQQILAGLINGTLKNGTQQTDITKNISKEAIFDCTIKHLKTNNRSSFISIVTSTYKDKKETTVNEYNVNKTPGQAQIEIRDEIITSKFGPFHIANESSQFRTISISRTDSH